MTEYTPPDSQAVDFSLEPYTAPDSQAVDFELDPGERIQAAVQSWAVDQPQPTITGAGAATVGANAQTWAWDQPTAQLAVKEILTPDPQVWALEQPTAAINAAVTIGANAQTWTVEQPQAKVGFDNWVIDGTGIETNTEETATPQSLALSYRVTTDTLDTALRPLKADQGKVDVLATDTGGFVAVDRANGSNSYDVVPPVYRQPLRESEVFHVDRYEESMVSQTVDEWDVELELVKAADRADTPSISETPAADEWGLTTRYGEIATGRVDAELLGTGDSGVRRYELTARLTFDQAHVFEAALAQLKGTRVRNIPDAPNEIVDETNGDANTITVDAPDGQTVVSDGEYVVLSWSSTRVNDAFQSIEFEIAEA